MQLFKVLFIKKTIFKKILLNFRERGREGETSMCDCLSYTPYWNQDHNPGMYPDWESNQ